MERGKAAQDEVTELSGSGAFEDLLNAVPDAVFVVENDGTIVACNSQAEVLFGYPREELLHKPVELLLPERLRREHVGHRADYAQAPRVRPMGIGLDLFGLRHDGSEIPVEISLSPARMQGRPVVIASIRDVSERKRLESERGAALKQLESIQTVTDTALASLGIDDLLPALLGRVRSVLGADTTAVLLMDDSGLNLIPRAALGLEEELERDVRIPWGVVSPARSQRSGERSQSTTYERLRSSTLFFVIVDSARYSAPR